MATIIISSSKRGHTHQFFMLYYLKAQKNMSLISKLQFAKLN